jgi:hypothetical protein
MAVGLPLKTTYADGDVYSASDVNDTNGTVNLVGQTNNFYAGKNKIINGNFGVWQRGSSFNLPTVTWTFTSDRFQCYYGFSAGTPTVTRQTFTPGTAPVAGYESQYFLRFTAATTGTSNFNIKQVIEDVRTFAGQTVTFSFWAKSSGSRSIDVFIRQNFGSGGSGSVDSTPVAVSTTTAWQRFTYTVTLGSMTGKTIGTNSGVEIWPATTATVTGGETVDFWGWQVEAGSTATAFQTATGTIQGELAACQRYLPAISGLNNTFLGAALSTTSIFAPVIFAVTARVAPTGITVSNAGHFTGINGSGTAGTGLSSVAFDSAGTTSATISGTTTGAGNPTLAANQPAFIRSNNAASLILFTGCEL